METARARSGGAWRGYLASAAFVGAATAAGALGRKHLALPDLVMLYLLTIMLAATLFGRGPSLVAATLSVLAYDFFFIPPFFTFVVEDERHLLTFAMMFVIGLLISGLTLRVRRHEHEARAREARTAALYGLSRDLGAALDAAGAARVLARHASETFRGGSAVMMPERAGGPLVVVAQSDAGLPLGADEMAAARWAFDNGQRSGAGTATCPAARFACVPLRAGAEVLGVLAQSTPTAAPSGAEPWRFLEVFAQAAALALQRARLAEEAEAAALRARTEEMRSALLSAVSHDLRTPLAAITGAASTLREAGGARGSEQAELLETICEEADRLERLVRNLLDMTRLESGALEVKRDWVPLEEIVGSALTRLEGALAGRAVRADLPAELPLVSADAVLLEQVFVNLFENVAKYTPAATGLEIAARARADGGVEIEVADRGPGLPAGAESRLFEKFFRAQHAGVPGAGLGLAICRGIVQAHGGQISAENRAGGGALVRIVLPSAGKPPPVPADEGALDGDESEESRAS
jgi:two-component system sensor histidine kinase KdpD